MIPDNVAKRSIEPISEDVGQALHELADTLAVTCQGKKTVSLKSLHQAIERLKGVSETMTSDCGSLVTGSVIPLNIAPNAFLTSEKQATALVIGAMGYINVQIKSALRRLGYDIVLAENVEDVGQLITNHDYQYVILDLNIPTPHEGLRMLDDLKKSAILHDLSFKIIAMSCGGSCAHLQQEAVGRGADQFLWRENDWQNRLSRFIEAAR